MLLLAGVLCVDCEVGFREDGNEILNFWKARTFIHAHKRWDREYWPEEA